jgi:hypothetical protein
MAQKKLKLDHSKDTVSEIFGQEAEYGKRTLEELMLLTREGAETGTSTERTKLFEDLFNAMNVQTLEEAVLLGIQFTEVTMAAATKGDELLPSIGGRPYTDNNTQNEYSLNKSKVTKYINTPTNDF